MRDAPPTIVLAAGLGTRLRPLTDVRAKPLVPVGDRPILAHILARAAAVSDRMAVNAHHHAAALRDYVTAAFPGVVVSEEVEILGTAGGVRRAAELVGGGDVVVWNGDILADVDLAAVVAAHRADPAREATLVVGPAPRGQGNVGFDASGRVVRLRDGRLRPGDGGDPPGTRAPLAVQPEAPTVHEGSPRGTGAPLVVHPGSPRGTGAPLAVHPGSPRGTGASLVVHPGSPGGTGASLVVHPGSPAVHPGSPAVHPGSPAVPEGALVDPREVHGGYFVPVHVLGARLRGRLPERGCLVGDLYVPALARGEDLRVFLFDGPFFDVGSPRVYVDANVAWLAGRASWVGAGARVDPAVTLRDAVVGEGAEVGGRGALERVVVWPGARAVAPLSGAIVLPDGRVVRVDPPPAC